MQQDAAKAVHYRIVRSEKILTKKANPGSMSHMKTKTLVVTFAVG